MLFSTFPFLCFFVVVFTVYWSMPRHRWRMTWLLVASFGFYMSWNPWLIGLIIASASIDYVVALSLERTASPRRRKLLVCLSVGANLSFLGYFKYANFFLASAGALLRQFGLSVQDRALAVVLPLGISFYTFEAISYVVEVHRGRVRAVRNPLDYALYIMFFPHLIAGPIVRPRDFLPQLGRPKRWDWDRMQLGVQFFLLGLFKKAVLADHLGTVADAVFAAPANWGTGAVWLGVLSYAGQIYGDFSGYSDMAVGLAHMLGFKLPANFHRPYFAVGLGDFWRRWHVSLSSWLRDYLYIPLGGSRGGRWATYRNLFLTMLLGGLWHGANWTFILWGGYHGLLLALERAVSLPRWLRGPAWRPPLAAVTFLAVCFGWVLFRAQSFADAGAALVRLVRPTEGAALDPTLTFTAAACLTTLLAGYLAATLLDVKRIERRLPAPALAAALACLLLLTLVLFPEDGKSFIYFQF
jgi:alginate O-acetyltransferase complex protein AlgI